MVHLFPDNPQAPFPGAFIDHEMCVCELWPYLPYYADCPINLPIKWQEWIVDAPGDGGDDKEIGDGLPQTVLNVSQSGSNVIFHQQQPLLPPSIIVPKNEKPTTIIFRDPIANPSELEAVISSSCQQPNWKAAQMEGQWEGTAETNIKKYQSITHPTSEDLS